MTKAADYAVADIGLAAFGRKEIAIAETEMPGLMATRAEYATTQPLKGARIAGSLHMTIQTAVLIETLKALGADVRWASCNIYSTQDHAAAAIAAAGTPVFAVKGESLKDYWDFTHRIFEWSDGGSPNMILDDGGDATLLIHLGARAEKGDVKFLDTASNEEEEVLYAAIKARLKSKPGWYGKNAASIRGVTEETTTGVHRLYVMAKEGKLLWPAINVNDSVTKSKFDNLYGCRESLVDGIRRGTDVMMAGKVAMVAGFGDVGKGSAASLRNAGCRVMVSEVDPICALQAAMEGYEVTTMDDAAPRADIFVTATGNVDVITLDHMRAMHDRAIVSNIGHFDSEIQVAALAQLQMEQRQAAGRRNRVPRRQEDHTSVGGDGSSISATPWAIPRSSCRPRSPTRRWRRSSSSPSPATTSKQVYTLPKHLDEKVASLHLAKIGVKLTKMTPEQSKYLGVPQHRAVQAGELPVLRERGGGRSKARSRSDLIREVYRPPWAQRNRPRLIERPYPPAVWLTARPEGRSLAKGLRRSQRLRKGEVAWRPMVAAPAELGFDDERHFDVPLGWPRNDRAFRETWQFCAVRRVDQDRRGRRRARPVGVYCAIEALQKVQIAVHPRAAFAFRHLHVRVDVQNAPAAALISQKKAHMAHAVDVIVGRHDEKQYEGDPRVAEGERRLRAPSGRIRPRTSKYPEIWCPTARGVFVEILIETRQIGGHQFFERVCRDALRRAHRIR